MAHNLATINGRVAMAYQGGTPWHKLGEGFADDSSLIDAIVAANLDWIVELETMYLADGRAIANKRAVVRDVDRAILGVVGDTFHAIQNREAYGQFAQAVTDGRLQCAAGGALGDGEKTWMLFRLPEANAAPVDGDDLRGYMVAINAHDGSNSFECRPTWIRVVCQNTLSAAVGRGGKKGQIFSIRHTSGAGDRVDRVGELVDTLLASMQATGDDFATLARRRLTPDEIVTYIETVFPVPAGEKEISTRLNDKRKAVAQLMYRGVGVELATQATNGDVNLWSAYNAVTEYFDHVAPGKAGNASAKLRANTSALFGSANEIKALALRQALVMV